jgi:signal transduction histidine kinase
VAERTVELVETNAEIQRFAHVISHDLRAPLINIMGFTSELQEAQGTATAMLQRLDGIHPNLVTAPERTAITDDIPEAIGFIRASTVRMDRLIKAILNLSRSGRREISARMSTSPPSSPGFPPRCARNWNPPTSR